MNLDIEKERMEFQNFAPEPLPGYWCERQEREFAVWCAAKARATPSPAPIPEGQAERLRHIGGKMSNVMYNLGQHHQRTFTDDEAKMFFVLAKQWDDAIAAAPTVKASQSDTHPSAALTDVERADALDAARYRYLMRQMPCNIADLFGGCVAFDEVDEEIDAAIVRESEAGFPVPRVNGKD